MARAALRGPSHENQHHIMSPRTILVADDNPLERKLLRIRLIQMGFQVATAQDGVEALEKARECSPAVIVTDVLMPRLDGFRLCQAVRRDAELASIPLVLTTSASIEAADRLLAHSLGANAFVQRTPDCQHILDAIQKSLAEGALRHTPANDALVANLRRQFLETGRQQSQALVAALDADLDPAGARQLAHRWAGMGGTLGFPQISQRAFEIEKLLERPRLTADGQLRAELEGIASLFCDAARGEQQTALPARETAAGLSGRRIALLGFQPADAARLSRALDQAQASSRILTPPLAPPGSPALGPFDLLILFLCRQTEDSHWSDPQALLRNGKPLLLIGPLDLLHEKTAALQEHAADFLLSPWHTGEVLLRASRILSAPRVAARSAAGPALDVLVLVADDDLTIGALLTATLQNCGIQCQIARHGVQALEMARSLRPDALVLDIMMPHLDGFEVLASLKSDPATRPIPVLLLTARQQEADIVRGFALGAEDYVVKPFNLMELVARLKRLMPRPLPAPVV